MYWRDEIINVPEEADRVLLLPKLHLKAGGK